MKVVSPLTRRMTNMRKDGQKRWTVKILWESTHGDLFEEEYQIEEILELDVIIEEDEDWADYPFIRVTLTYNL